MASRFFLIALLCLVSGSDPAFAASLSLNAESQPSSSSQTEKQAMPDGSQSPQLDPDAVVNLDGVVFETWVPQREWVVPANEPGAYTPITFGIRIINHTQAPVYLSTFFYLMPRLLGLDDNRYAYTDPRLHSGLPRVSDYPVAMPRREVLLPSEGRLYWENGSLVASGSDGYGSEWHFRNIQAGKTYLLWLGYNTSRQDLSIEGFQFPRLWLNPPQPPHLLSLTATVNGDEETSPAVTLEGVIGNAVETMPVEVKIVKRQP